jgi:hypothetical protein
MTSAANFLGEQRPELQHPSSNRFIGDVQPALGQQSFDIAEAEGNAKYDHTACRMTSGRNWWRANEISIRSSYPRNTGWHRRLLSHSPASRRPNSSRTPA